jgi:hypothetical protein
VLGAEANSFSKLVFNVRILFKFTFTFPAALKAAVYKDSFLACILSK